MSTPEIIGRGTWLDKLAHDIVERERRIRRSSPVLRTESGFGSSGVPHIGSFGDAARAYGVALSLQDQGHTSEFIAYSDDMDGLRRVPAGLPPSLKEYLGFPVSSITDPWSCHESYASHMNSLLLEALDQAGIEYTHLSATEMYRSGTFTPYIRKVLEKADRVGEIFKEETGQEKYLLQLPYLPVCSNCGRIYTARAKQYIPREGKILYECEGDIVRGSVLRGCGHKGESDLTQGEGKVAWKAEFAVRWAALGINFEAYGKDIADSVRANDRVCEEILETPAPHHIRYEIFLDKGGRKISKSIGNVLTPQLWYRYGSAQSLLLLMFKRYEGTREISIVDVPKYMDELNRLGQIYCGRSVVKDEKERAKLRGLYEYSHLLHPPEEPLIYIPYRLLAHLIKVAPTAQSRDYVRDKLRDYGYIDEELPPNIDKCLEYVANWVHDFGAVQEERVEATEEELQALQDLVAFLHTERTEDEIQAAVFSTARGRGIRSGSLFRLLYQILLGDDHGPRIGPYIKTVGEKEVRSALERFLESKKRPT